MRVGCEEGSNEKREKENCVCSLQGPSKVYGFSLRWETVERCGPKRCVCLRAPSICY